MAASKVPAEVKVPTCSSERALGAEMGAVMGQLHVQHGVDLRLSTGVATIEGEGRPSSQAAIGLRLPWVSLPAVQQRERRGRHRRSRQHQVRARASDG